MAKGKKKGTKGTASKVNKDEKAKLELKSAAEIIIKDIPAYKALVKRMEKWMNRHSSYLTEILQALDFDSQGTVNYEQFKSGLLDLHVPCNNVEIFLISSILDGEDSGEIGYTDLASVMPQIYEQIIDEEESASQDSKLEITKREFDHCSRCGIALLEPDHPTCFTYLYLDIRFAPLLGIPKHEFHKRFVYPAQALVQSLINRLVNDLDIASRNVAIFKDNMKPHETRLPVHATLEDCGYPGGNYTDPDPVTFFYDYPVEFSYPLLLSDNFMQKPNKSVAETTAPDTP